MTAGSPGFISFRTVLRLALVALAGAVLLSNDGQVAAAGPGVIERVGPGGPYGGIAINADGRYVAFTDNASAKAILIGDRKTDTTEFIGAHSTGFTGLDSSADGRYLAFSSYETLVAEDTALCRPPPNAFSCPDVYVYDRLLRTFELVSVASDGTQGNHQSGWYDDIALSADGRYVTFASLASNLAPDGVGGLFVRDRLLGTTERVALSLPFGVSMSADGRYLAFDAGDAFVGSGVFVHDRDTDQDGVYDEPGTVQTVRVSGDRGGYWAAISDDGHFVAFQVLVDPFGTSVVLHDRQSGVTTVVANTGDTLFGGSGTAVDLSGDGRFLAFASGSALVAQDTNGFADVYLYDRVAGAFELLSVAQDGGSANGYSAAGFLWERLAAIALTPDARYAAFYSWATNLAPGATGEDVFLAGTSRLAEDTDRDGCIDKRELGPREALGGRRNPDHFWDFFDVPTSAELTRDQVIDVVDILALVRRFGSPGDPTGDPLSTPPATGYHTAYDRTLTGPNDWNTGPPNGSIDIQDIILVVRQFGHHCRQAS